MYVGPVKKKKISLWILLLFVLFIVALIFTIIHIFNSTQASFGNSKSQKSSDNVSKDFSISYTTVDNSYTQDQLDEDEDEIEMVTAFTNFYDLDSDSVDVVEVETNPTFTEEPEVASSEEITSTKKTFYLKNHVYAFDTNKNVVMVDNNYIQLDGSDFIINMFTENYSFQDIKTKSGLKEFLQNNYNIKITSKIKVGSIKNNELIVFTMSEGNDVAYFFITPLNNSEVLCMKVYNSEDMSALLKDISKPLDEISSIKAGIN